MLVLNNKKVASTVKSAEHIDYNNVNSKLEATNVQDAIDYLAEHGGGGSSEAIDINYDDTESKIGADNVQEVIERISAEIPYREEDETSEIEIPNYMTVGYLPKLFISGDITSMTKEVAVNVKINYFNENKSFSDGGCTLKWQGNSSLSYPKKNFTLKMSEKRDLGFGKTNKVCLKANYIDHSHARNIVSARLWNQVIQSRDDYDEMPQLLRESPRNGSIDGFPIKLYMNGVYQGLYTWNIAKDDFMFNMDKTLNQHCVLCGENYESACFRKLALINETDWSDEIHDTCPEEIKTKWNEIISFVMNSSDTEFKNNLHNYFSIESLIDYYIFAYVSCGLDSLGKNQLFYTYDGNYWYATMYDMDSTWGLYWNGQRFVSDTYRCQEDYEVGVHNTSNLLYDRLVENFLGEIKFRYSELRESVLSIANIINEFERFTDLISKDLYDEDKEIYSGIPSATTNNIKQIRSYANARLAYVDEKMKDVEPIPPEPPTPPSKDPIYVLAEPTTFDGTSDYIDTELNLSGMNAFTIAIDFNYLGLSASDITSIIGMQTVLNWMEEKVPYPGITLRLANSDRRMETAVNGKLTDGTTYKPTESKTLYNKGVSNMVKIESFKIIYVYSNNTLKVLFHYDSETQEVITIDDFYFPDITDTLILGAFKNTNTGAIARYMKGTITDFKVYNYALSESEINAYFE